MERLAFAQFTGNSADGGNAITMTKGHLLLISQMFKDRERTPQNFARYHDTDTSLPNSDVTVECFDHNDNWFYVCASELNVFDQESIEWLESVKDIKAEDCWTQVVPY